MKLSTLLVSLGVGAGLMYLFDPEQGGRRRAMIRDKTNRIVNRMDDSLDIAVDDFRNRARGLLAEISARLTDEGAPDWILEERIHSMLGRLSRRTRGIQVRSHGGHILLNGPVLREEMDDLVQAVARTRGVHGVTNEMEVYDSAEDIPALQALPSERRKALQEPQRQNWSPAARILSGVGGSLLTLYGIKQRGLFKPVLTTAGLVLTSRSVTNMDPRTLLGMGEEEAIRAHKAINVNAPLDQVYHFWRNFDNFPRFMDHVKAIQSESGISKWTVAGPAGTTVEFQSHITRDIPNHLIEWETLPGSQVRHHGTVRFDENREGGTRITVNMQYAPPAGALGHTVAQIFGVDPTQAMDDDLNRLKSLLEEGQTPGDLDVTRPSKSQKNQISKG